MGDIDCFPAQDDATVPGALSALQLGMAEKSLEERVRAIEVQLAGKTLQEHFRAQAELIDQRFAEQDAKWERRIAGLEADVKVLKVDVSTLKKDMVIVREGISILLKKQS